MDRGGGRGSRDGSETAKTLNSLLKTDLSEGNGRKQSAGVGGGPYRNVLKITTGRSRNIRGPLGQRGLRHPRVDRLLGDGGEPRTCREILNGA